MLRRTGLLDLIGESAGTLLSITGRVSSVNPERKIARKYLLLPRLSCEA
jgi:hypothetical protein